jgi:hypothetical protein
MDVTLLRYEGEEHIHVMRMNYTALVQVINFG